MDIIELIDIKNDPDPIHEYSSVVPNTPLIIDNGSYKCRVGWNTCKTPLLVFRNVIAKPRKDRKRSITEVQSLAGYQVGNDIANIETVRAQLKTQFERNVITHFHTQEEIFDHIFEHLGINTDGNVPHYLFLTEAIGNPNFCRQRMNELLFETYGIPAINYGIDCILSYNHNNKANKADALILSFGFHTTHVIPVLNGEIQASRIRRLNLGGYHIITYLFRLMQMKYPVHINAITVSRMETLIQQHGFIALDYQEELKKWSKIEFYEENVRKIQLPFTVPSQNVVPDVEQKIERRKELTKRLVEANARRTRERFLNDEKRLSKLTDIRAQYDNGRLELFENSLKEHNIANLQEVDTLIKEIRNRLERSQKKICYNNESTVTTSTKEDANTTLIVPPTGIPIDEWLSSVNSKRDEILKKKHLRKVRRQDLAKRKTAAAQERMRIISQLARNEKGNDEFGMNDNDWDIYKAISRDDSESETENEQLIEYESILRQHDPNFEEPAQQTSNFTAEHYQLHFGVEALRCPEILFQPSMVGNPETGIAELIEFVLKLFSPEEQQRMVDNVFLTGGCAQFPGLKERLAKELTQSRPFKSSHHIKIANLPELDAWLGARNFTKTQTFKSTLTLKEEYFEKGGEFFKAHRFSNRYCPTPSSQE